MNGIPRFNSEEVIEFDKKAEAEGAKAFRDGISQFGNPYDKHDDCEHWRYRSWNAGWADASRDIMFIRGL